MAVLHLAGATEPRVALRDGPLFATRAFAGNEYTSAFYSADLRGNAIALGAFQRAKQALSASAQNRALRRATGGSAVFAGDGVSYFAIGLRDASVFLPCPPERVLNRNVRGMLVGLSSEGHAAHYFGRDFVSIERRPGVYVAWSRTETGCVLLEFFVSARASFALSNADSGYPKHSSPPLLDKVPITLTEAWGREAAHDEVVERVLMKGYAKAYGLEFTALPLPQGAAHALDEVEMESLEMRWSAPHEVPIGFISAGLRRDANGLVSDARLSGDFFQDDAARSSLKDALVGKAATRQELVQAINTVYGRNALVIEGVPSLNTILDAFTDVI